MFPDSTLPTLQRLPKEILEKPEFESYFVGAESKIDQVLSSTWLKQHTKHWTWKNYIMANTPRSLSETHLTFVLIQIRAHRHALAQGCLT